MKGPGSPLKKQYDLKFKIIRYNLHIFVQPACEKYDLFEFLVMHVKNS
jgi:hypothetical protein